MSDDLRFERNARAWLEIGPAAAPERVVQAALQIIGTTSQQRDLRVRWRFPSMNPSPRFAVVAVVAIVVIAGGFLFFGRTPPSIGSPSPIPSSAPSPSAAPTASPVANLLGTEWLGIATPPDAAGRTLWRGFRIDDTGLVITQGLLDVPNSWSLTDNGTRLDVEIKGEQRNLDHNHWACAIGDKGSYSIALSAEDNNLTLGLLSDTCATRAAILASDWTRRGELSVGRHVAAFFKPIAGGGSFSYTVPAGWSEFGECATCLVIHPPGTTDDSYVQVLSNVTPFSQGRMCLNTSADLSAASAATGEWLTTVDGLVATHSVDIEIGGLRGVSVDVAVAPGWRDPCLSDGVTTFDYGDAQLPNQVILSNGVTTFDYGDHHSGDQVMLADGARARYLILDAGDGQILLINIDAPDDAMFETVLAAAMPVIETFEFIR